MPKAHKFTDDFYSKGLCKYASGRVYPITDETTRQVALGHAHEVSVKGAEIGQPYDSEDPQLVPSAPAEVVAEPAAAPATAEPATDAAPVAAETASA